MISLLTDPTSTAFLASTVHLGRCHNIDDKPQMQGWQGKQLNSCWLGRQLHVAHLLWSQLTKKYKQANKWETVHSICSLVDPCSSESTVHCIHNLGALHWVMSYLNNSNLTSMRLVDLQRDKYICNWKAFSDKWFSRKGPGLFMCSCLKPSFWYMYHVKRAWFVYPIIIMCNF